MHVSAAGDIAPQARGALGAGTRLCIDIGASHVRVGLADGARTAHVVERGIAELAREHHGDVVAAVGRLVEEVSVHAPAAWAGTLPPIGVGVATVVLGDGTLQVGLSAGVPAGGALRDRLSDRFGTDVVVDNDASLAALGEHLYGAGKGEADMAPLTLGTNLGMGVIAGGEVYRGAQGAAGEIGTVPLRLEASDRSRWDLVQTARREHPGAAYPPEGYVWLEELYGGAALKRAWRVRSAGAQGQGGPGGLSERIVALASAGDPVAAGIVDEAIGGWALAIATACGVLDPGALLIGGGIAADLGPHLGAVREAVQAFMPGRPVRVELAKLGPLAGLIGATATARRGAAPGVRPVAGSAAAGSAAAGSAGAK